MVIHIRAVGIAPKPFIKWWNINLLGNEELTFLEALLNSLDLPRTALPNKQQHAIRRIVGGVAISVFKNNLHFVNHGHITPTARETYGSVICENEIWSAFRCCKHFPVLV